MRSQVLVKRSTNTAVQGTPERGQHFFQTIVHRAEDEEDMSSHEEESRGNQGELQGSKKKSLARNAKLALNESTI